jgi:histidine ammonia-lyase
MIFEMHSQPLTIELLQQLADGKATLQLGTLTTAAIEKSNAYLLAKINRSEAPVYGVNTGFGSLCDVKIDADKLRQLQENLIMSHACGVGNEVPQQLVKTMLLLKIQNACYGYSGLQLTTVQRLVDMYNCDMLPVVFDTGSLGASGDLAPLAHLSLPLLGKGEVYYNNQKMNASDALQLLNWQPLLLGAKEGLALLNGTQFMCAYSVYILQQSKQIMHAALHTAALSIDAFQARKEPFDPKIHAIRKHQGQQWVAAQINSILHDSPTFVADKSHVQDPYTFRCIPQVLGASQTVIEHVSSIITHEINAVTDNPNVFADDDQILSGGNFHGQAIALAIDYLKLALHEIGNISERRTYQLISGQRGLPAYLSPMAGLHSGLMIPQYVAAALVSKNKQLCSPASCDSITSSNGQEDHVSMGANAVTQCYELLKNLETIIAIEWLNASQALHLSQKTSSTIIMQLLEKYRLTVAPITVDRELYIDINKTKEFIKNQAW